MNPLIRQGIAKLFRSIGGGPGTGSSYKELGSILAEAKRGSDEALQILQQKLADVGVTAVTGKSSTEHVVSGVTRMDCQWSRLFIGWFPCLSNEEYLNNLMEMNCQTYSWNFLNNPYCKENV